MAFGNLPVFGLLKNVLHKASPLALQLYMSLRAFGSWYPWRQGHPESPMMFLERPPNGTVCVYYFDWDLFLVFIYIFLKFERILGIYQVN